MNSAQTEQPIVPERRPQFHSFIVVLLLLTALGVVYIPRFLPSPTNDTPSSDAGFTYIVDIDYWRRTQREVQVQANTRFDLETDLNQVPLQIGTWTGQEKPETNREVEILLEPEQYIRRLYRRDDGHYMWLSLIGGRSSQPFHPPDICYDADGWQYSMGSHGFELSGGGEIYSLWLDASKKVVETETVDRHVVSYFYIFPDPERALGDGIVLFKLTSNRIGTIDESLIVHEDFVRQFFLETKGQRQ
ncbi:MAG: exosortase-associated EpsI family protein [Chloroflexota bacterium]